MTNSPYPPSTGWGSPGWPGNLNSWPSVVTTQQTLVDSHSLQNIISQLHTQLATQFQQISELRLQISDLFNFTSWLSVNPGKTLDDWQKLKAVKETIDKAILEQTR